MIFGKKHPDITKWQIPKTWADLDLDPKLFESSYIKVAERHNLDQVCQDKDISHDMLLQTWSNVVEKAVDITIQISHKLDPMRYPMQGLTKAHFGRCCERSIVKTKVNNPPKFDVTKGYEPPEEIFREKSKMKVRQVRRLFSLIKSLKNFESRYDNLNNEQIRGFKKQLSQEWNAIRHAKGYGKSWVRWILGFECVHCINLEIPTIDDLQVLAQLTKHDCNIECANEVKHRNQFNQRRFQIDFKESSGKMTYRRIKQHHTKTLNSVPVITQTQAVLCRAQKGITKIVIKEDKSFQQNHNAKFGEAVVQILKQHGRTIHIKVLQGTLPSEQTLTQEVFAYEPHQISEQFKNYWEPIWNREHESSTESLEEWHSFVEEMQNVNIPNFQLQVDLHSPEIWISTIKKMKKGTAHGVCGWRIEELCLLPRVAICHLVEIFKHIWSSGMPSSMMKARTILLAKKDNPLGMKDSRPITILSILCRLASKIIADQLLAQLSKILPHGISGGLPRRGVKDISLLQHYQIELAISKKLELGGFTLDLVKAFNKIPRAPLRFLFDIFGIPSIVSDYWFKSLRHLSRYPQIAGSLGNSVGSTCGIPEGDSCSVLGMVILSGTFYYKLATPRLLPYAYADNWSWLARGFKEQFHAMLTIFNFIASLRMDIDYTKSWAWGATKTFRTQCQHLNALFPNGEIQFEIRDSAKDLGIEIHYNKQTKLGSIAERIQDGISRCERLRWIPCDISQKSMIIQTGIWPAALHSADTQVVGNRHWRDLRRAATSALVGCHKHASSYLACTVLSTKIQDPLLYNVCQMLRALRRCAFLFPNVAEEIAKFAFEFDEKTVYGPGGALKRYLTKIGWHFATYRVLQGPGGHQIDVFVDSPKDIQKTLTSAWTYHVKQQIQHRKGVGTDDLDLNLTAKVYGSFSSVEQTILALNLTGGFQTGAVKTIWTEDNDGTCPFCFKQDGRHHRIIECTKFEEVRNRHQEAINILTTQRENWIYLPIATKFQYDDILKVAHNNRVFPNHQDYQFFAPPEGDNPLLKFFTDGSCLHPTNENARIAGWAVVQDTSHLPDNHSQIIKENNGIPQKIPQLQCVATGVVTKKQSAARAELSAVVFTCEGATARFPEIPMEIYTDAQYVCNIIMAIQNSSCIPLHHKMSNFDLVQRLLNCWDHNKHKIFKVKAHRTLREASNTEDMWQILGNSCADMAASSSILKENPEVLHAAQQADEFSKQERHKLTVVFRFLIDLNLHQMKCLQENQQSNLLHLHSVDGSVPSRIAGSRQAGEPNQLQISSHDEAMSRLVNWKCENPIYFLEQSPPEEHLVGCSLGKSYAITAWKWLKTIRWPTIDENNPPNPADWGVSYLELICNFYIITGTLLPVATNSGERYVQYVDYFSDVAYMLPPKSRSANAQVYMMEKLVRQMTTLTGIQVIPTYQRHKRWACSSLSKLGFHAPAGGIPRRPEIQKCQETMALVRSYLKDCGKEGSLCQPFKPPNIQPSIQHVICEELSPKSRFNAAERTRKRRR